ncbi:hypothetical protein Syun_027316 [Stephania yunnanensis]|uniref:Major facilitator superfamily (MFS) profile domain-containing protein n=1 Tax=Stephania yunnanensis TaxID=152371 RepID=A0AAP0EHQ5_9MAGN
MFYAPVLFQTLGFSNDTSLISAVITSPVNVAATGVAFVVVDRYGRRPLFFQMLLSQVIIGPLICVYVAGFAWSWGPLGWLLPSEIFLLARDQVDRARHQCHHQHVDDLCNWPSLP